MKVLEAVERYFQAWNSHNGGAIAACFDPDGGYTDPLSGQLAPARHQCVRVRPVQRLSGFALRTACRRG